jgi:aspartate beta-hydroxylase
MKECEFDKNWSTKTNNNSWSQKDTLGIFMFIIIIIFLTGIILFFTSVKKIYSVSMVVISAFIILYIVSKDSVTVMYPTSALINMSTKTPEFLNKEYYFPNGEKFEKEFETIKDELNKFTEKTNGFNLVGKTADTFGGTNKEIGSGGNNEKSWRLFQIKVLDEILPGAKDSFPTIVNLLENMPEVIACSISILQPRVMIPSHTGYMKGVLRYMLPLQIPKNKQDCFLCLNKIKYTWTEGEGVLWDDTYPHMVENNTDETRVVIYMDVKRKDLSWFGNMLFNFTQWLIKQSPVIKEEMSKQETQIKSFK